MWNKPILRLIFLSISFATWIGSSVADPLPRPDDWRLSLPGWRYEFPRDHRSHPDFKTEWWYFTGNLRADDGREFGYQLTFFRQGVRPPSDRSAASSRFVVDHVQFVHFAISDIGKERFFFDQILSRGAFGEAGFGKDGDRLAWIESCALSLTPDGGFRILARDGAKSLDLELRPEKLVIYHGADGISRKGAGEGRASHYYSFTRLKTDGSLTIGGETFRVQGHSWYDHEWATNQLTAEQEGWDWFSLQFEDGSDLMMFQIRTKDGGRDPFSGGTFVRADGSTVAITNADFSLESGKIWQSPVTGAKYPVEWRLKIPSIPLDVEIQARMNGQELVLSPISYWEGSVRASGKLMGFPVSALGYLEMTGYAGPIVGMQASDGVAPGR